MKGTKILYEERSKMADWAWSRGVASKDAPDLSGFHGNINNSKSCPLKKFLA